MDALTKDQIRSVLISESHLNKPLSDTQYYIQYYFIIVNFILQYFIGICRDLMSNHLVKPYLIEEEKGKVRSSKNV